MSEEYDLVILGGGSAGLTAASFAQQLGVRVAIVEKARIGGDCTWSGCVPSKTLRKAAQVAHQMRTAGRYGLRSIEPAVNLVSVMDHVQKVIADIYHEETPEALREKGIDVYLGGARFTSPHNVAVGSEGETHLGAKRFLIATGAHPYRPPVDGLADVPYLTYETVWDLRALPRRLVVIGGGPVGCELAQAFRRLGSEVTLFASHDRLLSRDEPDASSVLDKVFAQEGIDVRYSARANRVWKDQAGIHVQAGGLEVAGDALLVATGRRPNVAGLELERAEVEYTLDGIPTDDRLRTSQPHIYAAGDATGGPQFTHYAGWQAAMAVRNALLPGGSKGVADHVPWTTFTDPEVAHAGLTEAQARARHGNEARVRVWPMKRVDRARTEVDTEGLIKLVHKEDGTLLGATVVAARAGEAITEWVVALKRGIKIDSLSTVLHVYPTYSDASMQAAAQIRVARLLRGASGRILRRVAQMVR
jgi:pyruvate/2-oxoglutarate dehydrogenase complex dihydrolipoamide dehydrogenase (E3) component